MQDEDRSRGRGATIIIFLLIIIIAFVAFWFFGRKGTNVSVDSQPATEQLSDKELEKILKDVGKLIVLPDSEPLVATVQDADALKKVQAFFEFSENGDRLLVYPDKALIYRPKDKRLINVGPVYRQGQQPGQPAASTDNPIRIDIRNGSQTQGAGSALADLLNGQQGVAVGNVANAANNDYTSTIIINLTGRGIGNMQQFVGATQVLGSLPAGEAASSADVLIIVGSPRPESQSQANPPAEEAESVDQDTEKVSEGDQ
jgi:hypothetical protein